LHAAAQPLPKAQKDAKLKAVEGSVEAEVRAHRNKQK
jgi:hypothetical protein